MKKHICVAQCPELDYDNSRHCVTDNPKQPFPLYDYDCPCGNCPIWKELQDYPTEKGKKVNEWLHSDIDDLIDMEYPTEKGGEKE